MGEDVYGYNVRQEVRKVIRKLEWKMSTGTDGIRAELIKEAGGDRPVQMHVFISRIWLDDTFWKKNTMKLLILCSTYLPLISFNTNWYLSQ